MKKRLVVVGNGMAGARVVEEILKRDREAFEIVMFGAEPYGNYNRILLSNVLNQSQEVTEITMNPLSWYEENRIKLHAGFRVVRIDRESRMVWGRRVPPGEAAYAPGADEGMGETIGEPYDVLIIATGSRPFVPPIEGFGGRGTFLFRTIDDCRDIAACAAESRRAVVIGGGLLGLEAARGLITYDVDVTIVEASAQLMHAQLDLEAGQLLKRTMETMGIRVLPDRITSEILYERDRVVGLLFRDGTRFRTDMVVVSAGIRPIVELAVDCGIEVNRGIVCDDQMRTSDPAVFAVGECVEHRGIVYGLVEPIWQQAAVLADVVSECGKNASYEGTKVGVKLKVMGVELASFGEKNPTDARDEVVVYRDPNRGIYKKLIIHDNRLKGGILLGDVEGAETLMRLFAQDMEVPENRGEILFGGVAAGTLIDVRDLPDSAQICNCNGVCKKEIMEAIVKGQKTSVSAVGEATKAGKGCGSCRGLIAQLIEQAVGKVSYDPSEHYYVKGVPLEKSQLVREIRDRGIRSVSGVFEQLAGGREDPESKPGLASLLKILWPEGYEDERDARFINDRVHANIQKDGSFSVVPRIYGGVTTPEELMRIAQAAVRYKVRMVKFTGGQRIDLLGVAKADLPRIWKDIGAPSGHAYTKSFRTCKSCVGTDFCRFGLGDSITLAQKIERRFQGIETPHKVKMATAGCPRNCSEAYVKDVGLVAVGEDEWKVYVGGAAGSVIRKGDLLATVRGHDEVIRCIDRFLQYYREHGKYMERTYGFVERVGLDVLKGIVMDDSLGICAQLEARMQETVDAYRDPWREGEAPVYSGQFEDPQRVEVVPEES